MADLDQKYCIDTSSILHAWRRDYPPDVFPGVWLNLEALIASGELISPEDVFLELDRGGDEIYEWAKKHRSMFIQPNEAVQQYVREIVNRYPEFVPAGSRDGIWADPYVIGLAAERHAVVVTGEKLAG